MGLRSLRTYLILAPDECRAWQWVREPDGNWPDAPDVLVDGILCFGDLGIELPVIDL